LSTSWASSILFQPFLDTIATEKVRAGKDVGVDNKLLTDFTKQLIAQMAVFASLLPARTEDLGSASEAA
jgi:hypothetical protein